MLPSYLEKLTLKELTERSESLNAILTSCKLCPHRCGIDRTKGETGICRSRWEVMISSVGPHFGEEEPLVGSNGSGTIFFSNCNLRCEYCQNYSISHLGEGEYLSIADIAGCMIYLQKSGCHNINLVTPTHYVPQIVSALLIAVERGLEIPIVYNCSGYESVETLKLLDNIVDIYMPDVKYSDNTKAKKYSGVDDYWEVVSAALKEMHYQVGDLKLRKTGIATAGLLVRHLVLPNGEAGSEKVLDFIANEISPDTYLNIMDQYRPLYHACNYDQINRSLNQVEYNEVVTYARKVGLRRGFY